MKLGRSFYLQPTKTVARELLGKDLVVRNKNRIKKYKIVETEAYLGVRDRACHSYNGRRTDRTEVMYLEGGHSYVYFIYGMYYCFNVVTRPKEFPEAVLIRAVDQYSGPGRVCRGLGITKKENALDLTKNSRIWIEKNSTPPFKVATSTRIGIESSKEAAKKRLRYFIKGN